MGSSTGKLCLVDTGANFNYVKPTDTILVEQVLDRSVSNSCVQRNSSSVNEIL